jgi:hypothetical protein
MKGNTMNDQTNIDSLLDSTLDDLADLPEFKVFPAGAYNATITLEVKKMGENLGVEMKVLNQETVELSDPTEEAPKPTATTSVSFMLNNEYGQGALKNVLKSLAQGLGLPEGTSNREIMELSKGTACLVVLTTRKDKNDATKTYQGLKSVTVL